MTLLATVLWGQSSLADYADVQYVLNALGDVLPQELKAVETRQTVWPRWAAQHDREIRERLQRGDDDTIINWLLFGTSFTREPRVFLDGTDTRDNLRKKIAQRTNDMISALRSADLDERLTHARGVLRDRGFGAGNAGDEIRLEQHLYAEVDRVVAERQQYMLREAAAPAGDVIERILAQSQLFRGRGLSLDTSVLASFAVDQALDTMRSQGLLAPGSVRRVAVIGPGLDFADKNSGFDFYPVQTLQPFTSMDSLVRLGLAARPEDLDVMAFDISPRVNAHIRAVRERAGNGTPYVLRLAAGPDRQWTPEFVRYQADAGDRIASKAAAVRKLQEPIPEMELREIEVRPALAARVTPVEFNVVTERWTGPPFDLVIATNVLVYYDLLDQALAFSAIESMLRSGGFFLTNNVVVELPSSGLRSVGVITVRHSAEELDHMFWYRRQ